MMYRRHALLFLFLLLLSIPFFICLTKDHSLDAHKFRIAVDPHFMLLYDGLDSFEDTYGLSFDGVYEMVLGLTHEALRKEDVEVAIGFTTDGKIKELNLLMLEDDQHFFPINHPALVVRKEVLEIYPNLKEMMAQFSSLLTAELMIQLNYLVDIDGIKSYDAALSLLKEREVMAQETVATLGEDQLTIGRMQDTQQEMLSNLTLVLLRDGGIPIGEKVYLLGQSHTLRTHLLDGKIDMYWEYIGNGWEYLVGEGIPKGTLPEIFLRIKKEDLPNGLIWLEYANFNSTYTIIMRKEHAEELGIETISDLAKYSKAKE